MRTTILVLMVTALAACGERSSTYQEGQTGPIGPQGPTGSEGPQGAQGPAGVDGPPGRDGKDGAQGQAGPTGAKGDQGPQGVAGPQGAKGDQGPPGNPGPAAEIVSCTLMTKIVTPAGQVTELYWARIVNSAITPNSLAAVSAFVCGRTDVGGAVEQCGSNGVTCSGPFPSSLTGSECVQAFARIDQGELWVSCGSAVWVNGTQQNGTRYATARISYRVGS